jgi:NADH-quinone oxidoreductase subunit D
MTETRLPDTDLPDFETAAMEINMGPQHPSTHGVCRLEIVVDGELIQRCRPEIGYLHRGIEKIAESLSISQVAVITDRADYLCALNTEFGLMLAAEQLFDVEIPERADYIRVILAELNRIANHMMFYGAMGTDSGFSSPFIFAWWNREVIQDVLEAVSGARMLHNYFSLGGLRYDVPADFKDSVAAILPQLARGIDECDGLLSGNEIFRVRTRGLNSQTPEEAMSLGLTGPALRATGIERDLRKLLGYSIYDKFDFEVPVGTVGDVYERYLMRVLEMRQSIRIIEQALEGMPATGEFVGEVPRRLRFPAGEVYSRTESPRGELGIYLVGNGQNTPYRLKIRAPAFVHAGAMEQMLVDAYIPDAVVIFGSVDIVLGEADR